jgi:hypothetical protein
MILRARVFFAAFVEIILLRPIFHSTFEKKNKSEQEDAVIG